MNTIVLAENIGKWLVPTSRTHGKNMYKIISATKFEGHHSVDYTRKPCKLYYGVSYDNSGRFYQLVSDDEAQAILNSRVKPHPNQKVIDKIREMKALRQKLGYKYV